MAQTALLLEKMYIHVGKYYKLVVKHTSLLGAHYVLSAYSLPIIERWLLSACAKYICTCENMCGCQASKKMAAIEGASRQSTLHKCYTREYKLEVVCFFCKHNLYQMAKRFSLNNKMVGCWVADEEKIKKSKNSHTANVYIDLLQNGKRLQNSFN